MSGSLLLGGSWYQPVSDLAVEGGAGCSWHLVASEPEGRTCLLQLWSPRPPDRELDRLREVFLQRFLDAEPLDAPSAHFGADDSRAWFLQELDGTPLVDAWPTWGPAHQEAFLKSLKHQLKASRAPRLLVPAALRLRPGTILAPRTLGRAPRDLAVLRQDLQALGPPGALGGTRVWELPPEDLEARIRPIRGRTQELTYLKSLVFGLNAPTPMERVVVLAGEEGMGQEELADWACAAVETEGLWPHGFTVQHEEPAGVFLARMLQALLQGFEADLYARHPETARLLARRLPSFAFLRGGRRLDEAGPVEALEIQAALTVLDFAHGIHNRLISIRDLERATPELQKVLRELVIGSALPWFFTYTTAGAPPKDLLGALRGQPYVAFANLNRLEDADLLSVLSDLLGQHDLPEAYVHQVLKASLGNPGLLVRILEAALLDGTLAYQHRKWSLVSAGAVPKVHEDLVDRILEGRLQRLGPAVASVVRALALADRPLSVATLGRTLGIAGDPLEDALRGATVARLVHVQEGRASLAEPRLRPLALEGAPQGETRRLARTLLKALQEEAGRPILSVSLQTLASDPGEALLRILEATEQDPPPPQEAERVVHQALELGPTPAQRARLWEFLGDAWTLGTRVGRVPTEALAHRSPYEFALEALGLAVAALAEVPPRTPGDREQRARVLRKRALLEIRLRSLPAAHRDLQAAAEQLTEQPGHLEQARLRLALGRAHLLEGYHSKGVRALEEGLQMLAAEPGRDAHRDQVALLLELGRAQGHKSQFQRALSTLQSAQRLLEHGQDLARLSEVLASSAAMLLAQGQPEAAYGHLREALQAAKALEDTELTGECHLAIGTFRSIEQSLGPALSHLDTALGRFGALSDRIGCARARVWKARTLAALGDVVEAEIQLLQALSVPPEHLTASERGEFAFLQAEIAAFQGAWRDARRLFQAAADILEGAGLVWRERLSRLRLLQAEACGALEQGGVQEPEAPWALLESLKAPVEGSNSRWLEMEWHRAHALLLSAAPNPTEAVASEALGAWSEVQAAARELRFPAIVLEASARSAALLLKRGERLGARSRLQDAHGAFQELWSRIPEVYGQSFLGRPDLHRFSLAVEASGLRFVIPERTGSLADWTPTQVTLSLLSPPPQP